MPLALPEYRLIYLQDIISTKPLVGNTFIVKARVSVFNTGKIKNQIRFSMERR